MDWTLLRYFGLRIGLVLLTQTSVTLPIFAQTAVEDSTLSNWEGVDIESTIGESELVETCDVISCSVPVSNFRLLMGSDYYPINPSAPKNALGSPFRSWLRYEFKFGTFAHVQGYLFKDAHEPVYYATQQRWFLTETKRILLAINWKSSTIFVGHIRIVHGMGLASGTGWRPLTSMASPTRLIGSGSRIRSGVSSPGLPTRRGIAITTNQDKHIQLGLWAFRLVGTASTQKVQSGENREHIEILDLSGTRAFTSESAVARRHLIRSLGVGGFVLFRYQAGLTSVFFERLTQQSDLVSALPDVLPIFSLFTRHPLGSVSFSSELAFAGTRLTALSTKLRTKGLERAEVSIEYEYQDTRTSPFGRLHRFFASPSVSLSSYIRTRLAKHSIFSAGVLYTTKGSFQELNKRKRLDLKLYYETTLSPHARLVSLVKHQIITPLTPLPIAFQDTPANLSSRQSSIQFKLRYMLGRYIAAQTWVTWVWRGASHNNLIAAGGLVKGNYKAWNASLSFALGHQPSVGASSLPVYYSDTHLSGRLPVSSSFGSFTDISLSISYMWRKSQLEVRFKEVSHPTDLALKQLIQFQYSFAW